MLEGVITALVTPMLEDGSVDIEAFCALIEHQIHHNVSALLVLGTTGEAPSITFQERDTVLKAACLQINHRVPMIVGVGTNNLSLLIELVAHAKAVGADACLCVNPYYLKTTQEGLYLYFCQVIKEVSFPILLYNVPSRTAYDISCDTVIRLAKWPSFMGIKDATRDLSRIKRIIENVPHTFCVYSGEDSLSIAMIQEGAKGCISVASNIVPRHMQEMCRLAVQGHWVEASAIQQQLSPLFDILCVEPNPIPVKWILHHLGFIQNHIRLPLVPVSEHLKTQIRLVLAELL